MSGTSSIAFEQPQTVAIAEPDSLNFAHETPNVNEADPIASFLERHGSTLIQNHEGQMVTVAEAMANCPPFARLVEAMGEDALALTATQRPVEREKEFEETETEEETEDRESEKSADDSHQEKDIVSKPEPPKVEQLQTPAPLKQETTATNVISSKAEVADNTPSGDTPASPLEAVKSQLSERVVTIVPSQEAQVTESPAAVKASTSNGGGGYFIESKNSEPIKEVAVEASARPTALVELDIQLIVAEEMSVPANVNATAAAEAEDPGERLDKKLQIDKLYQGSDPAIETNIAEIEAEGLPSDDELDLWLPADEQRQPPEEFVDHEAAKEQTGEDFILPAHETPAFNLSEYAQNIPEVVIGLNVPVEEVEQNILQVAGSIKKMEAEEAATVHQILDEIIHKISEAQIPVEGDSENLEVSTETEDAEEELKELFIQLFDYVGIEYSPELIDSCVKLALQDDIPELIAKIEQEDEEADVSQDRGTHEVIKQLLAAAGSIKKSVLRAYQIGKSALQLYSQQLVTAQ